MRQQPSGVRDAKERGDRVMGNRAGARLTPVLERKHAAHVGREEIDRVERERGKPLRLVFDFTATASRIASRTN